MGLKSRYLQFLKFQFGNYWIIFLQAKETVAALK